MEAAVIIVYYLAVLLIGYIASRRTKDAAGYLLGQRGFGPYTTALGVGASDMGGWLLIGLPGAVYVHGLNQLWMPLGLLIGAYINWTAVAKRLRIFSELADDAITLPAYLGARFFDRSNTIQLTMAVVTLVFFTVYVASGFVGFALLFHVLFGWSYQLGLIVGALSIVGYVCLGGFLAVNWVDVFQGSLMFFALILCPLVAWHHIHADVVMHHARYLGAHYFEALKGLSALGLLSLLGWGLGYFGQPHLLVRFMASKNPQRMHVARNYAMVWMLICLLGAMAVGMVGALYYGHHPLARPETVFLSLSEDLFIPVLAALLFAAVLSAIMSTISAQLLVCSSALIEDIMDRFVQRQLSGRVEVILNRLAVAVVAAVALYLSFNPSSNMLSLVSYAWAGLGASFGPAVLLSLYYRGMTRLAAIAGIITGATTVIVWSWLGQAFHGFFALYALVPGFVFSVLVILCVSRFTQPQEQHQNAIYERFDAFQRLLS